jgi:hypothetical protein
MATEGVKIEFTQDGIRRLAEAAWQVNERTENIGARRLLHGDGTPDGRHSPTTPTSVAAKA